MGVIALQDHIVWEAYNQSRGEYPVFTLWLTGYSGAGKSTLAKELHTILDQKRPVLILDGDNVRHGLCKDLGFSLNDRQENIRRNAEVAHLVNENGISVICALISPLVSQREMARQIIGDLFIECFVDCDINTCEARDKKGLYKKARSGEIKDFTGISSPYEVSDQPEITVDTNTKSIDACTQEILSYLSKIPIKDSHIHSLTS